jgi:CelD/BcsL family acetyltransferase involved in cellulose biosynthesis
MRNVVEAASAAPAARAKNITRDAAQTAATSLRAPDHAARSANATANAALAKLSEIALAQWQALAGRAIEPNGYYLPEWALAVSAFSRGRTSIDALDARDDTDKNLIGLMPAVSAWRAYKLPLPAFVTADVWPALGTVLLDRDKAAEATGKLMQRAREAGAHALILRDMPLDGAVMTNFTRALQWSGLRPRVLQSHERAVLDATRDAEDLLREALGAKKLKELRRQRNRLGDIGEVIYSIASTPDEAMPALEVFLRLEASGWKARRGTALLQDESHLSFIRKAVHDLAARGQCEIVSLYAGETPLAAAIVLRHLDRAFYFKLGVDERFAKFSPGVQLTLELTRHMCADETVTLVDSTAIPNHPMIDPIWRSRLAVGDILIPLYRRDPLVAAMRAALSARRLIREPARRIVQFVRKIKEKRP